jgi:DNA repair protein NreA
MKMKKTNPLYWGKLDTISSVKFRNLETIKLVKEEFLSTSVSPFVGRYGYPDVNLGILTPPDVKKDAHILDDQLGWSKNKLDIPQIVDHRSQLLNSRDKVRVSKVQEKLTRLAQEVALSKKSIDTEIHLKKRPRIKFNTDPTLAPFAANAQLKKATLAENVKIPKYVDKFVNDDVKSAEALTKLNTRFDEHYLSKILSVGSLGIQKNRKLVPTRWSITATDDTLGKAQIKAIKDYRQIEDYEFYFGGYLGNYYAILLIPDMWSYELFEIYAGDMEGKGDFMTDHETVKGRKDYASNTVGGYYAARLAITENLSARKRQASVLALRFIDDSYTTPLGVWVCRSSARESIKSNCLKFSSPELMFKFVKEKMISKYSLDIDKYYKLSKLLHLRKTQKRISDWF